MSPDFDPIAEAERQWRAHRWSDTASAMAAVTSIVRAEQILVGRIEKALAPFNLTFARFEALRLLAFTRTGSLPLGKMSDRLQVGAGSITNAVDRLERDGLVTRDDHPDDGRITLATITMDGMSLVTEATAAVNDVFRAVELSSDDVDKLVAILTRFRAAADAPA
ncbi:MAG TPA: MarR family transcriptional regulator [Acidimicrobiales bacterium]|nr:MarR family transcriptional regulator [Acidimicrobiales bacterium]